MRALLCWIFAAVVGVIAVSTAQSRRDRGDGNDSVKEKLIGAWHLAWMEEPGPDGKIIRINNGSGMLLYTRDGHMSVQIMFPKSGSALSNDYVRDGYEASFGSYDVDKETHTITHHVQGSITPALVGKDLTRVFQFTDGHLIIKSTRPEERWSVAWEHY